MTNYDDNDNWDLLWALYIIALGDKENSIKTINSLLNVNYSKDVKDFLIKLKEMLQNEE